MRCAHNNIEAESPCLACEIERLQAENAELRKALGFYADPDNWHLGDGPDHLCVIPPDDHEPMFYEMGTRDQYWIGGKRARAALAPKEDKGG